MTPAYGTPEGLPARLADWLERMNSNRSLPWHGLGFVNDLRCVMRLLSLPEFAAWLRTHPSPQLHEWAEPVAEAVDAMADLEDLQGKIDDQPTPGGIEPDKETYEEAVERLGDEARELDNIRDELVRLGVLAEGDTSTKPSQLLGLLFA